jgi:cytochrome-b5 reductase
VKKTSKNPLHSIVSILAKLSFAGALGAAAIHSYRQGWRPTLESLNQLSSQASSLLSNRSTSPGQFWSGIGIASVAQLSLTMGLTMWLSTKLDVQQEFTH